MPLMAGNRFLFSGGLLLPRCRIGSADLQAISMAIDNAAFAGGPRHSILLRKIRRSAYMPAVHSTRAGPVPPKISSMKLAKYFACLLIAAAAFGTDVGDTYQQVISENGKPKSQIEAGAVKILNYPNETIKLRDDVVVSVTAVQHASAQGAEPTPQPSPSDRVAATQREANDAMTKVRNIVNQPAPTSERSPEMRVWDYDLWFHPGSTKPDFNTVDIRNSQELPYEKFDYVSLKSNPNVVWAGRDLEFNSMTKFFYVDRSVPKKKLTEEEMIQINKLYRIIGRCERVLNQAGIELKPSS